MDAVYCSCHFNEAGLFFPVGMVCLNLVRGRIEKPSSSKIYSIYFLASSYNLMVGINQPLHESKATFKKSTNL